MVYKITSECILCGTCAEECPNKAIYEGETQFIIDPNKCTECIVDFESPRCAQACPLQVPVPDPQHQETREQLMDKWRKLHPGETPEESGVKK